MDSSSSSSSSRKSNKIRDIVRLQQILKKWKKVANNKNNINATTNAPSATTTTAANKSIKFLKKTLSFSERESLTAVIPKGYVAVCVGKELKRFVIPTEYLSHQVFGILLREAEEEFGFQQEGVLKFPCEVDMFQKILKMMEDKRSFSSPSLTTMLLQEQDHDHHDGVAVVDDHEKSSAAGLLILGNNINNNDDHHAVNCSSSPDHTTHDLTHRPQMCR